MRNLSFIEKKKCNIKNIMKYKTKIDIRIYFIGFIIGFALTN